MHELVFAHDPNRYITSVKAVKSTRSSEHISARCYFLESQSVGLKLIIKAKLHTSQIWSSLLPTIHLKTNAHNFL